MNMHQIKSMVVGFFSKGKVALPSSDAAVKSAKKSLTISPAFWFRRGGKNWQGKKSNRRTWAGRKAKLARRAA
jgi:hypothetical protein